jgi:hypothetical protein
MNIKNIERRLSDSGVAFLGVLIAQLILLKTSVYDYTNVVIATTILMELVIGSYFIANLSLWLWLNFKRISKYLNHKHA